MFTVAPLIPVPPISMPRTTFPEADSAFRFIRLIPPDIWILISFRRGTFAKMMDLDLPLHCFYNKSVF
jgi:hypothetical protein